MHGCVYVMQEMNNELHRTTVQLGIQLTHHANASVQLGEQCILI